MHYYRLFGLTKDAHGAAASPTIAFRVRARSSDVDTSSGAAPDFDGDGYDDLAIASESGASVFAGRAFGVPIAATKTVVTAPGAVTNAGDVDGDGFVDLAVGTRVFRGSEAGVAASPSYVLATSATSITGLGDVNGDGFADLAAIEEGRFVVLYGRASGGPAVGTAVSSAGGEPFTRIAAAGDVNGDGYADVLVARAGEQGKVELYAGGPLGLAAKPLVGVPAQAASIAGAGDVNGDGYADVAIAEPSGTFASPWRVRIHLGTSNGFDVAPSMTLIAPAYAGGKGPRLAPAGDVNGDGFDDLLVGSPETLIGAPTTRPLLVRAVLYFGTFAGPTSASAQFFTLPAFVSDYGGTFGDVLGGIGDYNGDGFADVALGVAQTFVPSYPAPAVRNYLYVHEGTVFGAWAAPTFRLDSPVSDTTFGTTIAARF